MASDTPVPAHYSRSRQIPTLTVRKDDIRALYELVQKQVKAAYQLQISHLKNRQPELPFDDPLYEQIRESYTTSIRITSESEEVIAQNDASIFDAADFPSRIKYIYISTHHQFVAHFNVNPRDYLEVFLDFRRPSVAIDLINLPSNPTRNESNFVVNGMDEGWVVSTFSKLDAFLKDYENWRFRLHRSGIYDAALFFLFLPIAIYWTYKAEQVIKPFLDTANSGLLVGAFYFYCFLAFSILARLLFQYARWILPRVEYETSMQGPRLHRVIWSAVAGSFILPALYDIIKTLAGLG